MYTCLVIGTYRIGTTSAEMRPERGVPPRKPTNSQPPVPPFVAVCMHTHTLVRHYESIHVILLYNIIYTYMYISTSVCEEV